MTLTDTHTPATKPAQPTKQTEPATTAAERAIRFLVTAAPPFGETEVKSPPMTILPSACTTVPLSTCPERVVKLLSVRDMGDLLGLRAGRALRRFGRGNHPLVVCAPWVAPTIILTCNGPSHGF